MPTPRPSPGHSEDDVVQSPEGLFAGGMSMIVCPPPDYRVEANDHLACRLLSTRPQELSDTAEQCSHALLRRACEDLAVPVLAHVLPEELEPFAHVHGPGLLPREFQPALG